MIQVHQLTRSFDRLRVLNGVSFQVERGRRYVLLGQSGIGKSVLLKILAGLLPPDGGHVRIQSPRLGMVFQKNALFDSMCVRENLEFPARERCPEWSRSQREKRTQELLEAVGLWASRDLLPDELSGGMQKRLGIARALIVEPDVLLYDEPTAGLDPITSRSIADLILRLQAERQSTMVCVTSDVMRALQMGETLGLLAGSLEGARIVAEGSPHELKTSLDPAVRQFLSGLSQGPLTSWERDPAMGKDEQRSFSELFSELEYDPF